MVAETAERTARGRTSGANVSSLRLSEQGYFGSGPREERDLSAPMLVLGQTSLSRATFDARAWALLGLATLHRI